MGKTAVIIGAGPAGLTAAYELVTRTAIKPIVIEKTNDIGGISKTVVHNGNRLDIGGHRFFSKSETVMKWWERILPLQGADSKDAILLERHFGRRRDRAKLFPGGPDPEKTDRVMLIRSRLSRIFFMRKFFDYPLTLSGRTLANLGLLRIMRIGGSYLRIKLFPVAEVRSLEGFMINRFGRELYRTFFRDYTEKVWGVPCAEIAADWGAQRIKGLSVTGALRHAVLTRLRKERSIEQKDTETSLIERFLYPKLGPGQMWETVAGLVEERGGTVIKNAEAVEVRYEGRSIRAVVFRDRSTGTTSVLEGDHFFSTMPVKDLVEAMGRQVPARVRTVSDGLRYRDFITVGLLLNKLRIKNETGLPTLNGLVPDQWIYVQERDVKLGRLQIFNNWSPYMVSDPDKVWIGLEYFCSEGDELWRMADDAFIRFAVGELSRIGIADESDVLDRTIVRMPKTYPAYFGTYDRFPVVREFVDQFENLFLIGRNGMHRYNNQDHSMLTAMTAVDAIIAGERSKSRIWDINTEEEYHEGQ
jgi:protoporphyrinogen oxidase